MNFPMRHAPDRATDVEVLICLVTVPVLSRSAKGPDLVPPTSGVYASMRPSSDRRRAAEPFSPDLEWTVVARTAETGASPSRRECPP